MNKNDIILQNTINFIENLNYKILMKFIYIMRFF